MSVRINAPFPIRDEAGLKRLRDAAMGNDPALPRARAMSLLAETDHPGKDGDLARILENEDEQFRLRYLAAMLLWRSGSRAALDVLIRATSVRDQQVLAGVFVALGRIGEQRALNAILKALPGAGGIAADHGRFAATLIGYRLGLDGNDLPEDETDLFEPLEGAARRFDVLRPSPDEAAIALRSLTREPFGIEYDADDVHEVRCGRAAWMFLFNREWTASGLRRLLDRKAFAGVVASRQEERRLYSVRSLILTSPVGGGGIRIAVYTISGEHAFEGRAHVQDNAADFRVGAVRRPGAFPLLLEGVWEKSRMQTRRAETGLTVVERRQPQRG